MIMKYDLWANCPTFLGSSYILGTHLTLICFITENFLNIFNAFSYSILEYVPYVMGCVNLLFFCYVECIRCSIFIAFLLSLSVCTFSLAIYTPDQISICLYLIDIKSTIRSHPVNFVRLHGMHEAFRSLQVV